MKTIKQSNTTASVTAGKMNSNQMINNSFGGMSATTGTSTSNTFDHRTFIKIVYGGRFRFLSDLTKMNTKILNEFEFIFVKVE